MVFVLVVSLFRFLCRQWIDGSGLTPGQGLAEFGLTPGQGLAEFGLTPGQGLAEFGLTPGQGLAEFGLRSAGFHFDRLANYMINHLIHLELVEGGTKGGGGMSILIPHPFERPDLLSARKQPTKGNNSTRQIRDTTTET